MSARIGRLAAEMLEVAPELPERSTLSPEHRAALEDRLAVVVWDGDACI